MRKQTVINLLIILITLSPAAFLLIVWKSIPLTFVTKFEFGNSFEKIQSRQDLLIAVLVLSVVTALLYLLMRNLRKIDPKVNESTPRSSFHKLGLIITLFLAILNYFFILSARNDWTINTRIATGFFGLLVALIGTYMNNLKPNYFAGIRLPWTLNDPDNWKQTHRLAGKLWFAGGIVLVFCSLILPEAFLRPVGIGLLVVLVVIPGIYSYRIFRSKRN